MKINTHSRIWFYVSLILGALLVLAFFHYHGFPQKIFDTPLETTIKQYPLIDPARHIVPREHFISTIQPLREKVFARIAEATHLRAAVYIEFLNTGSNIHVGPNERFWPASLTKVPIALAALGAVESGAWTLDTKLALTDEDKIKDSSTLYTRPTGTQFTVGELLEYMLQKSDNTAYAILVRNIPQSELDRVRDGLGLEDLFSAEGKVNAKEYSRVFRSLYTASYLNREHSQILLSILDGAEFNEFLSYSVPGSTPFPHKFGLMPEEHTYNDSGVVYMANRPYLITVLLQTDGIEATDPAYVTDFMRDISLISHEFFLTAATSNSELFTPELQQELTTLPEANQEP